MEKVTDKEKVYYSYRWDELITFTLYKNSIEMNVGGLDSLYFDILFDLAILENAYKLDYIGEV